MVPCLTSLTKIIKDTRHRQLADLILHQHRCYSSVCVLISLSLFAKASKVYCNCDLDAEHSLYVFLHQWVIHTSGLLCCLKCLRHEKYLVAPDSLLFTAFILLYARGTWFQVLILVAILIHHDSCGKFSVWSVSRVLYLILHVPFTSSLQV